MTPTPITPEELIKAGWSKKGNAWYPPHGTKGLTFYDGSWALWIGGNQFAVKLMEEI